MTDNDAGADMNSTPLSKLPPPPIMSDQPSLPQGATYQDVLKNVELSRSRPVPPSMSAPMQTSALALPQPQQQAQAMQFQQPQYAEQPVYAPRAQQRRAPRRRVTFDDDVVEIPEKSERFTLKSMLPGLAVAAIVFVVLFKIAPMIATSFPFSVDSVTGKFTTTGLLLVSFLAGGSFLFVDEMVLKKYD